MARLRSGKVAFWKTTGKLLKAGGETMIRKQLSVPIAAQQSSACMFLLGLEDACVVFLLVKEKACNCQVITLLGDHHLHI